MGRQEQLSELLRKMAEHFLMQMVLTLFSETSADGVGGPPPNWQGCLCEVLQFLASLTNPEGNVNSEETRCLGLSLVRVALETGGNRITRTPALVEVIQDDVCKFLLQNSSSTNLWLVSITLRVVFNLFLSVKEHLKIQLEVFFNSIHLRLSNSKTASAELKELVLESLVEFCREPLLMVDLYVNYDCDAECTNLFEKLCKFLCDMNRNPVR